MTIIIKAKYKVIIKNLLKKLKGWQKKTVNKNDFNMKKLY